jgi:hypothetical protein
MLRKKKVKGNEEINTKIYRRLQAVSDYELIRWTDNIHSGIGKNISEIRKSLTSQQQDQTLMYIEDTRKGAVSLLAALQALEERVTK